MSDTPNPISDTWSAIKNRLAGPFGTFVVVWSIEHPRVISYLFFDVTGSSGVPQAIAKADKIGAILNKESFWIVFGRPIFLTAALMLAIQIVSLLWHYISEWFRYFQEVITVQKDVRIYLFRRFGKNPEEFIGAVRGEIDAAGQHLMRVPGAGNGISAINENERNKATITAMMSLVTAGRNRLDVASGLLATAIQEPLLNAYNRWARVRAEKRKKTAKDQ